jgi:hypothetical protein
MSEYEADECIHGLGLVSACTICNGREARERDRDAREEGWRVFPTKFYGHCPGCNLPIHVGQMIAWQPDQPARHVECAS